MLLKQPPRQSKMSSQNYKISVAWDFVPLDQRDAVLPMYPLAGLRIASLPRQYRTEQGVIDLVEEYLFLGKVCAVKISRHVSQNGTVFFSAIVEMNSWNATANVHELLQACKDIDVANMAHMGINVRGDPEFDFDQRVDLDFSQHAWFPMSWDNGKSMSHLTVHLIAVGSGVPTPSPELELKSGEWTSLHIPILPTGLGVRLKNGDFEYVNESSLKTFVEDKLRLGKVRRIDFVRRDDIPAETPIKAAFIHFDYWYDNKNAKYLRAKLNKHGNFRQKGFFDGSEVRPFEMYDAESGEEKPAYFVFKINHRPIPEVDEATVNVHQLSAVVDRLSAENAKLAAEVQALREQVTPSEEKAAIIEA